MWLWVWVGGALVIGFHAGMLFMSVLQVAARSEPGEAALHIRMCQGHRKIGGQL